jgi:hypothetical protein
MNRPQQQHYVTRAYLDGFVAPNEKRLHVYTRGKTDSFPALPEKIAKIRNYYSTKREDGTYDDRLESMLQSHIEDPGLPVIRRLNAGHYNISRDARIRLSTLLAVQEYRVPWMREQMEAFMQGMMERYMKSFVSAPGELEAQLRKHHLVNEAEADRVAGEMRKGLLENEITLSATPAASLHAMGYMLELLPEIYFTMAWEILETKSLPFITSDCPVHRFYLPRQPQVPYGGLMDSRVEVRFPLSRTKMLVIRHDRRRMEMVEALRQRQGNRAAQKAANRASAIRHIRVGSEDVAAINTHTASMAARFIFSSVELKNASELLQGECKNVRQQFVDLPGGFTQFKAVFPK